MNDREPTAYNLTPDAANMIAALSIATMPKEIRMEFLGRYRKQHGVKALTDMFAEFFAVAASVEANTRESVELFLITDCNQHPYEAEKMNLPTIMGAMKGLEHTVGPYPGQCHGCAFRKGSYANQSLVTMTDAGNCVADGDAFKCHVNLEDEGQPTNNCVGWKASMAAKVEAIEMSL